ncbi:PAS domain S-box protein [Arthrobacter bambusae]|uniref:PAS domain S-box protein n=1 Tax=Arthrobacter bambusae TaxID=1338426 RepID=UPI002781A013|nr:PAS domain S-box protein [Arthrobacter bambusae]MDQ0028515.1 PAS domain S-box-containing protein [Arthrobacter bambusae]MDQ0096691.1 PAS domain S-box-containing protein [Arthrobacter bambusae]
MANEVSPADRDGSYRELLEAVPDALLVIGKDGNIAFVNAQTERLFGYPRSQLLGSHYEVLLPKRFAGHHEAIRERLTIDPRTRRAGTDMKVFGRHRDGTEFPIEISFAPLGAGSNTEIIASLRDVSERRRIEGELRDALSLLSATLESTADGILVVGADGRIAGSNERFALLWGIPAELRESRDDGKLIAFVLDQLVDPDAFLDKVRELYADPAAESLDMLDFRDGRVFERYSRPQRVGDEIVGRVWSFRDVTARRRAQDRAREALEEVEGLAAIVNSSSDAIVGVSPGGVITSWNPGAERLYGYPAAEAIGRDAQFIIPDRLRDTEEALLAAVMKGGAPRSLETERVRKDGSVVPVSLTVSPINGENGIRGIAKIGRDITARRATEAELLAAREAALESSRLKSEFLATMSHEIRTPMNGVIGLTALLLDTPLDEVQRSYAQGVQGAAGALLGLINDILDFSELEAGKVELDVAPFDPRLLVEEVAGLVAETAQGKDLELVAYCRPDVPAQLAGDAGRIRQILLNLASNAVKFTASGEVSLRVSVAGQDEGTVVVRFEVRDTGIGIDAADHARLFDSFAQADASTTRRYGGTGLGLAICRRLTEAMGGTIGLSSAAGKGSTFWFELPLEVAGFPGDVPEPAVDGLLAGRRVLVVDDNATNRLVLESQLNSWGLSPEAVADARTALERSRAAAAAGQPYEIAVLDMCMPDMDGLELARELNADPGLAGLRLMMLTSTSQVSKADLAAAGIGEWLTKPVRGSEFYDRLMRLLAGPGTARQSGAPIKATRPQMPSRGRVLVVEDNEVNQLVAREMVTSLGYRADVVADGAQAVSATAAIAYAAVLMDCHMPVMDGFEATKAIRIRESPGVRLPIIAMTAGALDEDRERCLAAGMDDYLTKPVDIALLDTALARWVRPTTPTGNEPPVLDRGRLATLRGLGPADGAGLLPAAAESFRHGVPSGLAALEAALGGGDREALVQEAHKLRGSAANIGAAGAAELCKELEQLGRQTEGRLDGRAAQEVLVRLRAELARVDAALGSALSVRP